VGRYRLDIGARLDIGEGDDDSGAIEDGVWDGWACGGVGVDECV